MILQLKNQSSYLDQPHFASHLMYTKSPVKNRKLCPRSSASNLRVLAIASVFFKLPYCIDWYILGWSFQVQWLTMVRFRPLNWGDVGFNGGDPTYPSWKPIQVVAARIWATLNSEMLKLSRGGLMLLACANMAKIPSIPASPPKRCQQNYPMLHESNETFWHGMKKACLEDIWIHEFKGCHGDTSLGNMFWTLFRAKALGRRKSWTTTIAVFGLQALAPVSLYRVGCEGKKRAT